MKILIALIAFIPCLAFAVPTAKSRTYKDTYDSYHIETSGTTNVATENTYVSKIVLTVIASGTGGNLYIKDKSSPTPITLLGKASLQVGTFELLNGCESILAKDGLDIIVGGNPAPKLDILITYSQ
jgi:hypothetical protein